MNWVYDSKSRVDQLQEIDKFHVRAYKISTLYKEHMKRWHVAKILKREFKVGDDVLLLNSRYKLFLGKLTIRWRGSFKVV